MYAMDFAQVGANIQEQLDRKGFTQQSLADELGISKQVMNKIIKGNKAINVSFPDFKGQFTLTHRQLPILK